jgi:hypothetical protein
MYISFAKARVLLTNTVLPLTYGTDLVTAVRALEILAVHVGVYGQHVGEVGAADAKSHGVNEVIGARPPGSGCFTGYLEAM